MPRPVGSGGHGPDNRANGFAGRLTLAGPTGAEQIWRELAQTMRAVREASSVSLRDLEADTGWRRGTISQIERGLARPNRDHTRYYDEVLGGDGLVTSLLVQAHVARIGPVPHRSAREADGELSWSVIDQSPPSGDLLVAGADVEFHWTVGNDGAQPWAGLVLYRVGAVAGAGVIASEPSADVPDCPAGGRVDIGLVARTPDEPGTYRAHWRFGRSDGALCRPAGRALSVTCVVAANP